MKSRFTAIMDGISLNEIDDRIVITEVEHYPASVFYDATSIANRYGQIITNKTYSETECRITFMLRVYRTDERQKACQEIVRWAKGSILEVNDRPGQRLRCVCKQPPAISSVEYWLREITMIFTGYAVPFWEETIPSELVLLGDDEEGTLFVPGNAEDPFVSVEVTPQSGTLTSITLTVGEYSIALTGLNVSTSQTLVISYDDRNIQSIKVGNNSVLSKRTASSSDDLIAKVGGNSNCSVTSNVNVKAKFTARGCWL